MGLLNFLSSLLIIILIAIIFNFNFIRAQPDDNEYGMCGDPDCKEPIAHVRAFSLYAPIDSYTLRLKPGDGMVVYVRDCWIKKGYFGVELEGKKGYVPKNIVREIKVMKKATFPAKQPFIAMKNNDVPNTKTQVIASPTAAESGEPQSQSSHPESHSTTTSGTIGASQSHQTNTVSSSEIGASPTTKPPVPHSNNDDVPAASSSPSPISNTQQPSASQDNAEKDHLPKSLISQYTTVLNNQINKTVNAIVKNLESQNMVSSADIKPTESSVYDEDKDTGDQEYEKTMEMMKKRGINYNETDSNSRDSQFSDSPTTATATKLTESNPSSSFNKQSASSSENVSPTGAMLPPSSSPYFLKPSESIDSEKEQITGQENPSSSYHHSQTTTPDIPTIDPHSVETEVLNEGNYGYENTNDDSLDKSDQHEQNHDYNEDEGEHESDEANEDENDHLISALEESISRTINSYSSERDGNEESQRQGSSDSITFGEAFEKENTFGENYDSIKTPYPENEAGSSVRVSQTTEAKSSSSNTFSSDQAAGYESPQFNFSSDVSEFSDNQAHTEEDSLPNAISDASSRASDSSTRAAYSRHILEDGSGDGDTSIYTMNQNHDNTVNIESGAGGELQPGYFSVETLKWTAGSFLDASANIVYALKAFLDLVIAWSPEPFHSTLKSMNFYGMSARAVVFTALSIVPTFLLFVLVSYIQRNSKESSITAQLCEVERKLYQSSVERNALLEENNNLREQYECVEKSLVEDRSISSEMKDTVETLESQYKQAKMEIKSHQENISHLSQENEDLKKKLTDSYNKYEHLSERLRTQENDTHSLSEANEKLMQDEIDQLSTEKQQLLASEELYKEKISSLEQSCKQLLQEAEIWNARVSELTEQVYSEASAKKEAENLIQSKDSEIETLKTVISSMEALTSTKESGEGDKKSLEESMQLLMDAGKIQVQLKKSEELSESLSEKLKQERNKVLEMEVELLESKSEVDKLKVHYNQALQDKAEAQTKLDVLTKYFKDKELQLQKELGVQEAFRQRKEEDATHAERRIHLIEEENASYKFQVATLKQEIEETERNLKNQIANQEKKAHENWLAARNAERKMEEMKQEHTQLRQRLTLLEREQEKWSTSSQGDVIRPVPQRVSEQGHDILSSNDGNISMEFLPRHIPPPPRHPDDMIPPFPPPAHLPMPLSGRPILPPPSHSPRPLPPPMMPPFMPRPPFDPVLSGMPPHRPLPWSTMSEKRFDLERRKMPSDFDSPSSRRNQTPPHSESSRRSVSPTEFNSRSRSSSPSVPLPDFHNTPPRMGRPDLPPPPPHMRYVGGPPPHFMHRRDFNSGASPFRDGNRAERLSDEGSSSSRTRNFSQPRQASEEEV